MEGLLILVLLVLAGLFAYRATPAGRRARAQAERKRADAAKAALARREAAQELFDLFVSDDPDLSKLPDLNSAVQGVILQGGERCVALSHNATHIVKRRSAKVVGYSQGVSFRVAKGVRYRVGGFTARPVVHEHEEVGDTGSVYVTNKRVVFAGKKEVTSVPCLKVGDVHIEPSRVVVIVENRVTPLVLGIGDEYLAPVIGAAAHHMASVALQSKRSHA